MLLLVNEEHNQTKEEIHTQELQDSLIDNP